MISAVFLYNLKGEVLISRLYRHDLKRSIADAFRIQVISNADVRSPVLTIGSTTFLHVRHENLYVVAVTRINANAAMVFEFLDRLISLGKSYFGKFDEDAVKSNFVLIYELLDEILDFGYPQNSESDTLKLYITTEGVKSEKAAAAKEAASSKVTMQATGATAWRRQDIKYRKNEAFIDIIESVNLLMSSTGTVLRADVTGNVQMRAYLTGTPECKFGLNDSLVLSEANNDRDGRDPGGNTSGLKMTKGTRAAAGSVALEDCQFHQCVRLGKFDSDRTISFVPPVSGPHWRQEGAGPGLTRCRTGNSSSCGTGRRTTSTCPSGCTRSSTSWARARSSTRSRCGPTLPRTSRPRTWSSPSRRPSTRST